MNASSSDNNPLSLTLARRVDAVCLRFEAAWQAGPPRLEDFLAGWEGPDRLALLRELVQLDADYRRGRGEAVRPEDYGGRFCELELDWFVGALQDGPDSVVTSSGAGPGTVDAPQHLTDFGAGEPALSGYEVLGELGRGGMGVVFKAKQISLDRVVALKMVLEDDRIEAKGLARFRAEAEAVARLQHPGIIQIFEFGEQEGRPWFALEYCAGGSLAGRLGEFRRNPDDAVRLVESIARAVQAAHEAGFIHRDLKPGNILFTADGAAKVADFGLARILDRELESESAPSRWRGAERTATGSVVGTPAYMAPEQAEGRIRDISPATDVWALGAMLCTTWVRP